MDLAYAVSYVFEDKQWLNKLVLLVVWVFLSLIPVVGLFPLTVVLGYFVLIVDNVRNGLPRPLPKWQNFGDMFQLGAGLLVAGIVYMLPLIFINLCINLSVNAVGGAIGNLTGVFVACCILPVTLLYTIVMLPTLAVGTTIYSRTRQINVFFRVMHLFDIARVHSSLSLQWLIFTLLIALVSGFMLFVPCIGWIALLSLPVLVHAHLMGQFARRLAVTDRPRKAKAGR